MMEEIMTGIYLLAVAFLFISHEVALVCFGYFLRGKPTTYTVREMSKESDICGCGIIIIEDKHGFIEYIYVGEENAVFDLIKKGDSIVRYVDEDGSYSTAIPLTMVGRKIQDRDEKWGYHEDA